MKTTLAACGTAESRLRAGALSIAMASLAVMLPQGSARAGQWTGNSATSPVSAEYWSTAANWTGDVPNGNGAAADFTTIAGDVYVKLSGNTSVGSLKGAGASARAVIIGEDTLNVFTKAAKSEIWNAVLYTDVIYSNSDAQKLNVKNAEFCGDLHIFPYLCTDDGTFTFRADRYANDSNPVRIRPLDFGANGAGRFIANSSITVVAPHGSDEVKGNWSLTEGSPYLTFAGSELHVLAAGTLVTGGGFPSGTFLKRIFPDGTIELSNVATATGTFELTFAAFTPSMYVNVDKFSWSGAYPMLNFAKWREEDDFRFEVNYFTPDYNVYIGQGLPAGTIPATMVLHDVSIKSNYDFQVDKAHLEFAERMSGSGTPGLAGLIKFRGTASALRVTVTNGISAVIGGFKGGLNASFRKDGAGTLAVGLSSVPAQGTGSISVDAGTLAVTGDGAEAPAYVNSLTIKSGAVLKLPEQGLKVAQLAVESGAIVEGPGYLILDDPADAEGVVFRGGASAVKPSQISLKPGDYLFDVPAAPTAANLPGNPAVWFDASDAASITYDAETLQVTQWNDRRGSEYRYCTADGLKPTLVTNKQGLAQHVYIPKGTHSSAAAVSTCYGLFFDRELKKIKHAFRVLGCRDGGGEFFAKNEVGYQWQRGNTKDFNSKLFCWEYGDLSANTTVYMNGVKSTVADGFAYPGGNKSTAANDIVPVVAEVHLNGTTVTIDNFGYQKYVDRDGRERIYESIYYTNELSNAEIVQVRAYLMKKWLNAEVECGKLPDGAEALAEVAAGDAGVFAPHGKQVVVPKVAGNGELVKSGAGEVCIGDISDVDRDIHVAGGTLKIRSLDVSALPGDPYLHVDADDAASRTVNGNGKLTSWADVRGEGYPVVTINSGKPLTLVSEAQNGRTAVGFGSMQTSNYYKDFNGATYPEADVHTVFSVLNTANGGGVLIGHDSPNRKGCVYDGRLHGIGRGVSSYSDPIVDSGLWYASLSPADTTENKFSIALNRAGATRTRLNGTDVNAKSTGYSGGWDLVSLATHDPIIASGICCQYGSSYWRGGGCQLGEHILYRENLCSETVKRVEAYLRKKWFDAEVEGYRAAKAGAVTVDDGATLEIVGGAPLEVAALAGAGTVSGGVVMRGTGELTLAINDNGTLAAPQVTGGLSLPSAGVVRVLGNLRRLSEGETLVMTGVSGDMSGWTALLVDAPENSKFLSLVIRDGNLYLNRTKPGMLMLVR